MSPDMVVTNNDTSGVVISFPLFNDETLLDAAGATYAAGTLLGRITATNKLTKYTSGAVDGSEVPIAVLRNEVVLAAGVDTPGRPIVSGNVRRAKLVADGVGAITIAEADQLRDFGIVSFTTTQLAEQDNQ